MHMDERTMYHECTLNDKEKSLRATLIEIHLIKMNIWMYSQPCLSRTRIFISRILA